MPDSAHPPKELVDSPGPGGGEAAAEWTQRMFRWIRIVGIALVAVDVAAMTWLLFHTGLVSLLWSLILAVIVAGTTTYGSQFSQLLSKKAFGTHKSPGRHLLMAVIALAVNVWALWLVRNRQYAAYALVRVLIAAVVIWAWGSRVGPRLLGDGKETLERLGPVKK